MPISAADRVRIREARFAYARTARLRAADPGLEAVLRAGTDAADALYTAVTAVLAEEADDAPVRATRDRAAAELRAAALAAVRRFRALADLRATDPLTGKVTDPGAIDAAAALAASYLPESGAGGLPVAGPSLQVQAALVRDALAAQPECAPLAANLATLLDAHAAAMEMVAREADELTTAREALDAARERSDRMRRAGWHYLNYAAAFQDLAIDIATIWPVRSRGRTSDAEADAALDAAGAETVPEAGAKTP